MKRTILVVLMAIMIATPCFAQEVEPDGLFSIEGTRWGTCGITFILLSSESWLFMRPFINIECSSIAFYRGKIYSCSGNELCRRSIALDSYIGSPLISIAYDDIYLNKVNLSVMQPTAGIGLNTNFGCNRRLGGVYCYFGFGIMFKVDNDWSPYDQPISCLDSTYCPDDMVCVDDYCVNE